MTIFKILDLIAALSGASGTAFLYAGTFGLVAMTPYTNSQIRDDVAKLNQRLRLRQRIGLWLLMLSFVCSLVHAIIE